MSQLNYRLSSISMVMLGVKEIKRSVEFYRDRLGLTLRQQFEGFAMFDTGSVTLVLSEARAQGAASIAGATEVIFMVEGVRAGCEALKAQGVEFSHEPHQVSGPMWAANFPDPDGHLLTLFGPEQKS
jgi:catechol 2,3-dioxygenase-like lactoylglutathione lyase family enzyme